jgi:elongation factor Ts
MAISAEQVKVLRDRTGAGMMDCKSALIEANGDMEEAITILRKRGLAQAAKKSGRTTNQGLVGVRLSADARRGLIAEVNCESDFVARTPAFQALVDEVTGALLDGSSGDVTSETGPDTPVGRKVAAAIATLGENIVVSRAVRLAGDGVLGSYIHMGGIIGVLVELTGVPDDKRQSDEVQTLLREAAMQVAAASPAYATRAEIPADVIEREKSVYRAQVEASGKRANVIDKIVDGKLGSFYAQSVLPDQASIRDPKQTVGQLLSAAAKSIGGPIAISRFVRLKIGEAA